MVWDGGRDDVAGRLRLLLLEVAFKKEREGKSREGDVGR
jgi:hypothetical protein